MTICAVKKYIFFYSDILISWQCAGTQKSILKLFWKREIVVVCPLSR